MAPHVQTDLRSILANAAESVETSMGTKRLRLAPVNGDNPVWIVGDARELEQVFVNLFTNARDASPEEGEISCDLAQAGGFARVTVCDRGAGIDESTRQRLFQPFFTTKKSGGTGLGLVISREIVRRHGGEMGLESREGGGVEAWVTLPMTAPEL